MKKPFLLAIFLINILNAHGQQKAVTETGETVVLYNDGRWIYINRDTLVAAEIKTNPQKFERNKKASFLLKSTRIDVGCWLDPKKWTFQKAGEKDASEYEINNVDAGLYGLLLTEKINLPIESLANIALMNAREAAPDVIITTKEYREVNGLRVLMMQMTGTIEDIPFSYYGYYYATQKGAVQFLVYSSKENVEANLADIEILLNGLVEISE